MMQGSKWEKLYARLNKMRQCPRLGQQNWCAACGENQGGGMKGEGAGRRGGLMS